VAASRPKPTIVNDDLLETLPGDPTHMLPVVSPSGQTAAVRYAAPMPPIPVGTPTISILIGGFGYDEALSRDAISRLPGAVDFAASPYVGSITALVALARAHKHELFLSLPMEPAEASRDDEGPEALGFGRSVAQNQAALRWSLSRLRQYVGVTNAIEGQYGGGFAHTPDFAPIAREIAARGLIYFDATPSDADSHDVVRVDANAGPGEIDAALAETEKSARTHGHATLMAGALTPVLLDHLSAWSHTRDTGSIALVPVSRALHQIFAPNHTTHSPEPS